MKRIFKITRIFTLLGLNLWFNYGMESEISDSYDKNFLTEMVDLNRDLRIGHFKRLKIPKNCLETLNNNKKICSNFFCQQMTKDLDPNSLFPKNESMVLKYIIIPDELIHGFNKNNGKSEDEMVKNLYDNSNNINIKNVMDRKSEEIKNFKKIILVQDESRPHGRNPEILQFLLKDNNLQLFKTVGNCFRSGMRFKFVQDYLKNVQKFLHLITDSNFHDSKIQYLLWDDFTKNFKEYYDQRNQKIVAEEDDYIMDHFLYYTLFSKKSSQEYENILKDMVLNWVTSTLILNKFNQILFIELQYFKDKLCTSQDQENNKQIGVDDLLLIITNNFVKFSFSREILSYLNQQNYNEDINNRIDKNFNDLFNFECFMMDTLSKFVEQSPLLENNKNIMRKHLQSIIEPELSLLEQESDLQKFKIKIEEYIQQKIKEKNINLKISKKINLRENFLKEKVEMYFRLYIHNITFANKDGKKTIIISIINQFYNINNLQDLEFIKEEDLKIKIIEMDEEIRFFVRKFQQYKRGNSKNNIITTIDNSIEYFVTQILDEFKQIREKKNKEVQEAKDRIASLLSIEKYIYLLLNESESQRNHLKTNLINSLPHGERSEDFKDVNDQNLLKQRMIYSRKTIEELRKKRIIDREIISIFDNEKYKKMKNELKAFNREVEQKTLEINKQIPILFFLEEIITHIITHILQSTEFCYFKNFINAKPFDECPNLLLESLAFQSQYDVFNNLEKYINEIIDEFFKYKRTTKSKKIFQKFFQDIPYISQEKEKTLMDLLEQCTSKCHGVMMDILFRGIDVQKQQNLKYQVLLQCEQRITLIIIKKYIDYCESIQDIVTMSQSQIDDGKTQEQLSSPSNKEQKRSPNKKATKEDGKFEKKPLNTKAADYNGMQKAKTNGSSHAKRGIVTVVRPHGKRQHIPEGIRRITCLSKNVIPEIIRELSKNQIIELQNMKQEGFNEMVNFLKMQQTKEDIENIITILQSKECQEDLESTLFTLITNNIQNLSPIKNEDQDIFQSKEEKKKEKTLIAKQRYDENLRIMIENLKISDEKTQQKTQETSVIIGEKYQEESTILDQDTLEDQESMMEMGDQSRMEPIDTLAQFIEDKTKTRKKKKKNKNKDQEISMMTMGKRHQDESHDLK
jgi:hypothetical protein